MPSDLSPFEHEIMQAVWLREPATVKEILVEVNIHRQKPVVRTSVLKQIQRLETKKLLKRDDSRPARYSAVLSQKDAAQTALGGLLNAFFGNSKLRLVKQLLDEDRITRDEVDELTRLIKDKIPDPESQS